MTTVQQHVLELVQWVHNFNKKANYLKKWRYSHYRWVASFARVWPKPLPKKMLTKPNRRTLDIDDQFWLLLCVMTGLETVLLEPLSSDSCRLIEVTKTRYLCCGELYILVGPISERAPIRIPKRYGSMTSSAKICNKLWFVKWLEVHLCHETDNVVCLCSYSTYHAIRQRLKWAVSVKIITIHSLHFDTNVNIWWINFAFVAKFNSQILAHWHHLC